MARRGKEVQATGAIMLATGIVLNILDAYFSGNLPFSPAASDSNNKVSQLNRFGQATGSTKTLGTLLALAGGAILVLSWILRAEL